MNSSALSLGYFRALILHIIRCAEMIHTLYRIYIDQLMMNRTSSLVRVTSVANAECYYCPDAFLDVANESYLALQEQIPWTQGSVKVYTRVLQERRLTCLFSDTPGTYHYAGKEMVAEPWNVIVDAIRERLISICSTSYPNWENWKFDTCLCNYYRAKDEIPIELDENGEPKPWKPDMISWHADSEDDLIINSPIASVSFGAEKRFDLRPNTDTIGRHIQAPIQHITVSTILQSGSLFIMGKHTQRYYMHQVPEQRRITSGRINLTFRNTKRNK